MTRPLTPAEILAALKRYGIPYHEQAGWTTRHNGQGWGDVVGFMWHHTGDDAADDTDLRIVRDGRAGLPGPLCQFGLRDDGTVDLVAQGAANHAGGGDPAVLASLLLRNATGAFPAPRYVHGEFGSISGNPLFYGVETYYSGSHAPTAAVAAVMPRLAAAILDALSRVGGVRLTARRALGHKEWQRGKVDPGSVSCATLRTQTQALLDTPQGDTSMSAAEQNTILAALATHEKHELDRYSSAGARYSDLAGRATTQTAQIVALTAALAALAAHPDLTPAQITQIISDAITAQVKVTGTLTVVPT